VLNSAFELQIYSAPRSPLITQTATHRVDALRTRLLSRLDQQLADLKSLHQQVEQSCDVFDIRDECRQTLAEFAVELDRDRYRLLEQMDRLAERN
jgi:hypothetical protein